eukprot:3577097-Amphidinium_carterae.1
MDWDRSEDREYRLEGKKLYEAVLERCKDMQGHTSTCMDVHGVFTVRLFLVKSPCARNMAQDKPRSYGHCHLQSAGGQKKNMMSILLHFYFQHNYGSEANRPLYKQHSLEGVTGMTLPSSEVPRAIGPDAVPTPTYTVSKIT